MGRRSAIRVAVFVSSALCLAAQLGACHHDSANETKRDPARLDGMEQTAARRVGLESATEAMQSRDLERLKMLSVWVRGRAKVVLFAADDLKSLDLAIACLDGSLAPGDRTPALDQVKSARSSNQLASCAWTRRSSSERFQR